LPSLRAERRGIGRYVAHTFLHAGGKVAIVDNDEALLHRTVRELLFLSTDVMGIKADVSQESEVSEMVERVSTRFDRIDVLVNNAGIEPYFALNEMDGALPSPTADFRDPLVKSRLGGDLRLHQTCVADHEVTALRPHHQRLRSRGRQRDGRLRRNSVERRAPMLHKLRGEPSTRLERLRGRAGPGELSDCRG
jgi:hypothetical protein